MKKLLVILTLGIALANTNTASAQGHRGGGGYYRPRTTVVVGGGLYYSPFYSPFGYYGYPYYTNTITARPSKLDQEIADINHDYAQRIESARFDNSLTGKERRHEIRELKEARDRETDLAKRNYYKQ